MIDSAGVAAHELAASLGHPTLRGQSPFAIEGGNRFEDRLKHRSGYELLVEALVPYVELPKPPDLLVEDVNRVGRLKDPQSWMDARVLKTDAALTKIARGDSDAPHIVDHPVLRFEVAGASVNLEPDALAFRIGDRLELVEIKAYPIIDGQADPVKVSATAGQTAVYHMALRETLERLGFDPELLVWSVILVAPRNFGRQPVAHRVPLKKKSMSLGRVLRSVPKTADVLEKLPPDLTFDVDPGNNLDEDALRTALSAAVSRVEALYVPNCVQNCDMAKFCRAEAWAKDDPARLGRDARDNLAGVHTLTDALRLAEWGPGVGEAELADVAEALSDTYSAIKRARALVPTAGVTPPAPTGGAQ
ncbi:hypothetical protein [Kocuria nitroreducens]|uniref:hypothetical protein n=1 Tax=Kocuria nitroreducens TaxID=3058914 RepID=UPI0036DD51A8